MGVFDSIAEASVPVPTAKEEAAAALLRAAGWSVTPPAKLRYGCFCELDADSEPDNCVIDEGHRSSCTHASAQHANGHWKLRSKEKCPYWRAWTSESLAQERGSASAEG